MDDYVVARCADTAWIGFVSGMWGKEVRLSEARELFCPSRLSNGELIDIALDGIGNRLCNEPVRSAYLTGVDLMLSCSWEWNEDVSSSNLRGDKNE